MFKQTGVYLRSNVVINFHVCFLLKCIIYPICDSVSVVLMLVFADFRADFWSNILLCATYVSSSSRGLTHRHTHVWTHAIILESIIIAPLSWSVQLYLLLCLISRREQRTFPVLDTKSEHTTATDHQQGRPHVGSNSRVWTKRLLSGHTICRIGCWPVWWQKASTQFW